MCQINHEEYREHEEDRLKCRQDELATHFVSFVFFVVECYRVAIIQKSSKPALRNHSLALSSSRATPLPSRYIMPMVVMAPCRP